jgi:hypothetical protein
VEGDRATDRRCALKGGFNVGAGTTEACSKCRYSVNTDSLKVAYSGKGKARITLKENFQRDISVPTQAGTA